jgi:multidrug transporter EmrE-like cation transporter
MLTQGREESGVIGSERSGRAVASADRPQIPDGLDDGAGAPGPLGFVREGKAGLGGLVGMSSTLPLILLSVLCGIGGQLTLKMGMNHVGQISAESLGQPLEMVLRVLTTPLVICGLGLYVVGAVFWLTVLSRVPLSYAYPILALTYAITPLLAWFVLGESVPSIRWLGVVVICAGVFIVSRS